MQNSDCYLLKHIAVRSEVLNGTVGGYRISISGLGRSTQITPGGLAQPYLPYIDVEIADDAEIVSHKLSRHTFNTSTVCKHPKPSLRSDLKGTHILTMLQPSFGIRPEHS